MSGLYFEWSKIDNQMLDYGGISSESEGFELFLKIKKKSKSLVLGLSKWVWLVKLGVLGILMTTLFNDHVGIFISPELLSR